jgi:hypothetical protein
MVCMQFTARLPADTELAFYLILQVKEGQAGRGWEAAACAQSKLSKHSSAGERSKS